MIINHTQLLLLVFKQTLPLVLITKYVLVFHSRNQNEKMVTEFYTPQNMPLDLIYLIEMHF